MTGLLIQVQKTLRCLLVRAYRSYSHLNIFNFPADTDEDVIYFFSNLRRMHLLYLDYLGIAI